MDLAAIDKANAEREAKLANQRLNAIRDAERFSENKGLLGKTFKVRDNFSFPEKPSDYWWQYAKVEAVDAAGHLSIFSFQIDKYGHITIRTGVHHFHMRDYLPCPKTQFDRAWRALQHKISKTKP